MFYKIENELFTAEINDMGAELHSFKSKKTGEEFIWFGKTEIWYGQAPVLFPVIGQLKNDRFVYNGKEYSMPKHGLARKLPFEAVSVEGAKAVFSLKSNEETLKKYPFDFELVITFEIIGSKLVATHTVNNLSAGEMYFSLGAHPGFNCAVGDTIEFEKAETVCTERIDHDNLIIPEKYPLLESENKIEITKEIFEPDALILSGLESKKLVLNKASGQNVEFTFGDCTFLGIWAKPGAPYVCLEPWFGVNDGREDYGEISGKRGICRVEKGESFSLTWSAEVL